MFTDDASDFDIKLFYGSGKDYASFNFSSTRYSAEKRWLGYTVCFWVKVDMDPKSDSTFFTYFSTSGKQVFKVIYAEDSSKLSFKGYDNERYEQSNVWYSSLCKGEFSVNGLVSYL